MDYIPPQVAYAAAKLDSFSINKFRLETSGQTSASEGSVVTISLPESTLCMLPSFRVHFDATTTSSTVSGKTVYGKLPNASDLVSAMGNDFTDADARTAAANVTYNVSNIRATIDCVNMPDAYEAMLMDRLQSEDFLPINYLDYSTFQLTNQSGGFTHRFSISSRSINNIMAVMRQGNYTNAGVKVRKYEGARLTDNHTPAYFYFESFNSSTTQRGTLKYQFTCNGIKHGQFQMDVMDAAADLSSLTDQLTPGSRGHRVTSLQHYQTGAFVVPRILSLPGQPINVTSGFNSLGTNTNLEFEISGITAKTAAAAGQVSDKISCFVAVQTTKELRISQNRQVAVAH